MKTDTMLTVGALAIAAGLVLMPRRARGAVTLPPGGAQPRVGGAAGTVWDDAATARYREQLAREAGDWTGP